MNIRVLIVTFVVGIILTLNSSQGAAMGDRPDYIEEIKTKYSNITLSDGISREEAIVIAQNYMINEGRDFYKNFDILRPIVEENQKFPDDWIVGFHTTMSYRLKTGLQWNAMYINKKTGAVKYSGEGPS